jgi:lycopene beta-cyclase
LRFAHAFVGNGLAGVSLAWRLARAGQGPILFVDPTPDGDDRTFGFWTDRPLAIDPVVERRWRQLVVRGGGRDVRVALRDHTYGMVRDGALREWMAPDLRGVTVVRAAADRVEDGEDGAVIVVNGERFVSDWVYDSRVPPPAPAPYVHLVQSFEGVCVETDDDAFDPDAAVLMDFRTVQEPDATRFFYVLPVTARRAIVMGVAFAPTLRDHDPAAWVREGLGIANARVLRVERGATPMTDRPFPRRRGKRVLAIGIAGGRLKPSTGYALTRIQDDSDAILASLARSGHPFDLPEASRVWAWGDAVMLRVLRRHGPEMGRIFALMFARNPPDRVLRFLDEGASFWDVAALIGSLPPAWFVAAGARLLADRVGRRMPELPGPVEARRDPR